MLKMKVMDKVVTMESEDPETVKEMMKFVDLLKKGVNFKWGGIYQIDNADGIMIEVK